MLIDFSDVLRVNVYTLGSTFLKLIKALNIDNLPLIDPSLYMARFTAQLNLDGEEISQANTHKVTNDALKVLQRMKRDWIHFGRRPSGLCGAALLLACHMNGFKKTTTDIVKVVKICDQTLKKRLVEFMHTSNGELSVEQFKAQPAELAGDGDNPPCFKQQQLYRKFISYDKDEEEEEDSEKAQNVEAEMKKSLADIKAQNQALDPLTPPASSVPASTIDLNTDSQTIYPTWEFVEVKEDLDEWSDMSDIDDEIEELLLDEDERKVKEQVWYELNRDWVELQELKAKNLAEKDANENGATKPRRKRKAETDADFSQPVPSMKKSITGTTASEVTKEVVSMKVNSTFSKKILYHNLDHLF
jgi:transcription factor IIIB subunit 2